MSFIHHANGCADWRAPVCWQAPWPASFGTANAAKTLNVYSITAGELGAADAAGVREAERRQGQLPALSGEALARLIAEKGNPKVDVLFGGPVETHRRWRERGLRGLQTRGLSLRCPLASRHEGGMWTAIADDPLVFMTNKKFLTDKSSPRRTSWNDWLNPAYANMLQRWPMRARPAPQSPASSRCWRSTARRNQGLRLHEEDGQEHPDLHKSGGGGTLPVGAWPVGGWHLLHRRRARYQGQHDVEIGFERASALLPKVSPWSRGPRTRSREEAD